jgi:hypothetical protein
VVGAPRFELGTSCAQGRRNHLTNLPRINRSPENIALKPQNSLYVAVPGCRGLFARSLQKPLHDLREIAP